MTAEGKPAMALAYPGAAASAAGAGAPVAAPAKGAAFVDRAWRLARARWKPSVAFVLLLYTINVTRFWSMYIDLDRQMFVYLVTWLVVQTVVWGVAAIVGPILAEAAGAGGWRGHVLTVAVTVSVVALGIVAMQVTYGGPLSSTPITMTDEAFALRNLWTYSVAGLLFAVYCRARERELEATRARQAAELERARAQRAMLESRLKVLQARVEPELLFGALAEVKGSYRRDPGGADALLDDLIVYLRAALPQMRDGASTLARELALAEAYLKIVPAGRSGRLTVAVQIDDELGDTAFPPVVLLPLVHVVTDAEAARIAIDVHDVRAHDDGARRRSLAITLAGSAMPEGWTEERLESLRTTLQHYFGPDTTLASGIDPAGARATIVWTAPEPGEIAGPTPSGIARG